MPAQAVAAEDSKTIMKTKIKLLLLLILAAFLRPASAQLYTIGLTNITTLTNVSSAQITIPGICTNATYTASNSASSIVGDLSSTAWGKANTNFNFLQAEIVTNNASISALLTNAPVFTTTNTASTNPPSCVLVGVTNGIGYFFLTIPAGAPGTNFVTANVFSNGVYSSTESTLTNVNPLVCSGSNYIGFFPQLYDFVLNTPNTGVGTSIGSNLVENIYASYDNTNYFIVTNSPCVLTNPVYVAVVGQSNTNFSGQLILYSIDHPEYIGRTNSYIGQGNKFPDPVYALDAVNLESLQNYVANAVGSIWNTIIDTNGVTHYRYAPSGQPNLDLTANTVTWSQFVQMKSSGTNWVLGVTNLVLNYQLQYITNLLNKYSWVTLSGYTSTTNIYNTTNIVTFTVPQVLTGGAPYAFFRVVAFQTATATVTPPLTLLNATICPSNTWSVVWATVTNALQPGGFANFVNSNGVGQYKIQNTGGSFLVTPQ